MRTLSDLTEPTRSELRTATRRARRLVRGQRYLEVCVGHAYLVAGPAAALFTPRLGVWWVLLAGFVGGAAVFVAAHVVSSMLADRRRQRALALEGCDRVLLHAALATAFSGGRHRRAASTWLDRLAVAWPHRDLPAACVREGTAPGELCPRFAHRALAVAFDPRVGALWASQPAVVSARTVAAATMSAAEMLRGDGVDDIAYALVADGDCALSLDEVIAAARSVGGR